MDSSYHDTYYVVAYLNFALLMAFAFFTVPILWFLIRRKVSAPGYSGWRAFSLLSLVGGTLLTLAPPMVLKLFLADGMSETMIRLLLWANRAQFVGAILMLLAVLATTAIFLRVMLGKSDT